MAKKKEPEAEIEIVKFTQGTLRFFLLGTEPLILNRKTEQVRRSLLLPPPKKNAAAKSSTLLHDPVAEFRASIYRFDPPSPTLLGMPSTAFKGAMCSAAVDVPGAAKAQMQRLTYVPGYFVPVWGIPKLLMSDVKQGKGLQAAPAIRTRAIVEHWASVIEVRYAKPALREPDVANLVATAGITIGVGDFRQEKGKGNHGLFRIVAANDSEWKAIVEAGARDAQESAMKAADPFNPETFDLLAWFKQEAPRRGFEITT